MIVKVEVQTAYERFIIQIPEIPDNLTPAAVVGQTVTHVLNAIDEGHVVFQGADAREGQLIFIAGDRTAVKHIVLLGTVPEKPTVEDAAPEGWKPGPHTFLMTTNFASQTVRIQGLAYKYLQLGNPDPPQACVYVPISVNDKPALDALGLVNLRNLMFNYLRNDYSDHAILIPPDALTWEQAVEYAEDWVKEGEKDMPHVAKDKTAKAWYGHKRSGVAEE